MAKCACSKRKNNVSTPNWVQTWQNFHRLQIRMHLTQTMMPTHYCTQKWAHASWTIRVRFRSCNRCSGPTNLAANSGTFAFFFEFPWPKKPKCKHFQERQCPISWNFWRSDSQIVQALMALVSTRRYIYIIIRCHILLQQWYVMCSPFLLTRASVSSLRSFSSIALPMGLPMWCTGWATKPSRKTRGPMCAGLGSKPRKKQKPVVVARWFWLHKCHAFQLCIITVTVSGVIYIYYSYIFQKSPILSWFPPEPPKNNNGLRPWLLPQTQLPIAHHLPPCESLRNAIRGTISDCSSPAWSRKAVRWYCEGGSLTNNNAQKIGIVGSKLVIWLDCKSVWKRDSLPVHHILSWIFALVTICILYTISMKALSTVICCQCGMPMNQANVGTVTNTCRTIPEARVQICYEASTKTCQTSQKN